MKQLWVMVAAVLALASFDVLVPPASVTAAASSPPRGPILVVGATGSTGFRAIKGLLDVGYKPRQIRLLTRNANSDKCKSLKKAGFQVVEADLDEEDASRLKRKGITRGCVGCYVHSTTSDTAELDTGEVRRAQILASIIVEGRKDRSNSIRHVVYNSAAAQENHGVKRIAQKHSVEKVFGDAVRDYNDSLGGGNNCNKKTMSFTSLRAWLFMEELWKSYTRPQILSGTYPLPVPGWRKIYLVSVRDLGRLAGFIISHDAVASNSCTPSSSCVRTINVAGDYISAKDIAKAFAVAQGSACYHHNPRMLTLKAWWSFPELYDQIRFFNTFSETTDVNELRSEYPGLLTSFEEFLKETQWSDEKRTFEDFSDSKYLANTR